MTDITAVLNLHAEGSLAHPSLLSIRRAREACEGAGLAMEVLILLDAPDAATRRYAATLDGPGLRVVEAAERDLGLARNVAVAEAWGEYVAFLDGDDLWGRNWPLAAHRAAVASPGVVWHPEASLTFGAGTPEWFVHGDDDAPGWDVETLALRNHWTALSFAAREDYRRVPYRRSDRALNLGFEDWCWNMDAAAAGLRHRIVPGTVHLVRLRAGSMNRGMAATNSLPTPSDLFRDRVRARGGGTEPPGA